MGGRSLRHTGIIVYGNSAQDYVMADDVPTDQKAVKKAVRSWRNGDLSVLNEVGGSHAFDGFMQMLGADYDDDDDDFSDDGSWDSMDSEEAAAYDQSMRAAMGVKDPSKKEPVGWTEWKDSGYKVTDSGALRFTRRKKQFVVPEVNMDDDEEYWKRRDSSPIPADSLTDIKYTVVGCGYTSRIPLSELPNAFWATDGVWGDDQQTADAAEHIAILKQYFESDDFHRAFMFHGLADIDDLMSFGHCGCFNHANLIGAEIVEVGVGIDMTDPDVSDGEGRCYRVLFLGYNTESG